MTRTTLSPAATADALVQATAPLACLLDGMDPDSRSPDDFGTLRLRLEVGAAAGIAYRSARQVLALVNLADYPADMADDVLEIHEALTVAHLALVALVEKPSAAEGCVGGLASLQAVRAVVAQAYDVTRHARREVGAHA